jgi:hypothetical protein
MLVVYAGAANANADATFAAAAADPASDLEAMAGELTSKCLHSADSCCCSVLAFTVCGNRLME